MIDPPKTLPLLSYGDVTKNTINQISHTFQRSTDQPRINFLPLPPILPQSQNENLQPPEINSIPALSPMVEPVLQPLRVKIQDTANKMSSK